MASHNTLKSAFKQRDFKKVNRLLEMVHPHDCPDYPLICELTVYNQKALLEKAFQKGWSANVCDQRGYFPIHLAVVERGDTDLVKYLVHQGADVNQVIERGSGVSNVYEPSYWLPYRRCVSALLLLGESGDGPWLPMLETLVSLGADINAQDNCEENLLHRLGDEIREGRIVEDAPAVIQYALEKGIDMEAQNWKGSTPLMRFVSQEMFYPYAEMLIDHGANLYAEDNEGDPVFNYFTDALMMPSLSHLWSHWVERSDIFHNQASLKQELPQSLHAPQSKRL